MKGKKSDLQFVSEFIAQSIQQGYDTPESISGRAKNMISKIDEQIKRLEEQKIIRSKLLDVIETFEKSNKNKLDEIKVLSFYKLSYPEVCERICSSLKEVKSLPALSWASFADGAVEHNFSIKQLIEYKIIIKAENVLLRGERFDDYIKFLSKDK